MSFHATPQGSLREQQQPVSLLFSPSLKATDGQKHSPAALGRSPSTTPGPFGAAPATGFGAQGSTPPSRRRSLTPASSMAKDTPPPPPAGSLLDSPGLGGAAFGGWATAEPGGVEDMATSPSGAAVPAPVAAPPQPSAAAGDYAAAGRALREYDSTWVTVFGFAASDVPAVLSEFGKCGDIVGFGTYEDGPHVNWLHIKFANKHAAQRALLRSGDQLSSSCMVGVKPLDPRKRDALERQLGGGAGGAVTGPALPKLAGARPYQVNATSAAAAVVPLPSKSAWEKVSEFILGL